MKLDIVYEDNYIIACNKPFGVPSQPDKTYGTDMVTLVKEYLYEKGEMDEEPYVAVINRLDRPVAGIILFAKDEKTAASLTDMVQDREITKYYQAVVKGYMQSVEGELRDYIVHDKKTNISHIVSGGKGSDSKAKLAVLKYEVLDELDTDEGPVSYLLIELETGRHHQIRAQLAANGNPIWGDDKYGEKSSSQGKSSKSSNSSNSKNSKNNKNNKNNQNNKKNKSDGIGLFSTKMEFDHPVTGEHILLHREPEGGAFDIIDQMDW